jgi:hypothetical protein
MIYPKILFNQVSHNVLTDMSMGDVIRLRKPHPCGTSEWVVVRLGADIGLKCLGCQRRILLPRREVARRMKAYVHKGDPPGDMPK